MPGTFAGRVVIVTGGGSGIGLATTHRFAREGARVVVAQRDEAQANEAAAAARAQGTEDAMAVRCDVGIETDVETAVATVLSRWHRIDVIVNNAAKMTFGAIADQTAQDWRSVLDVNLLGPLYFIRAALRHMEPGGAVVNVASVHAIATTAQVAPYSASKAALLSLTRSAGIEGAAKGIRVNAVICGAVDTPMLWSNPNVRSGAEKIAPGEVGRPEDVAAAIAFLASDAAKFIQGSALRVDGGRLSRL